MTSYSFPLATAHTVSHITVPRSAKNAGKISAAVTCGVVGIFWTACIIFWLIKRTGRPVVNPLTMEEEQVDQQALEENGKVGIGGVKTKDYGEVKEVQRKGTRSEKEKLS
ncbi:hypothetical protein BT69DRAFT_1280526 [Atractiella rhizophila]|nr:hypothetical protein BT69DRAFT_1280526 [Atractiella rhizophila]